MAREAPSYENPGAAAWLPLGFLACLAAGAFLPLAIMAAGGTGEGLSAILADPVVWRSLRFTVLQAVLSTGLSVLLAVPVTIALFEARSFPGRSMLLRLFVLPLALPQIVAVLGIVGLYGEQGAVTRIARSLGIDPYSIYGLTGILVAHVFFNMPLAVRIMLGALANMPGEYDRLAHQLGMGLRARLRHVMWPFMRPAMISAATLILMLCVTSFTVVLTLGGGPRATTLEVAIYQALTFDFDLGRAVFLAVVQVILTLLAFALLSGAGGSVTAGMTVGSLRPFPAKRSPAAIVAGTVILAIAAVFVFLPFAVIVWRGVVADLPAIIVQPRFQKAFTTSLALGLLAACLSVTLSMMLSSGIARAAAQRRFSGRISLVEWLLGQASSLILVVPPVVIAAGWFIVLRQAGSPYAAAPVMIVAVNAAMAVPFAMRLVTPAAVSAAERYGRLSAQLGLTGLSKLRLVTWPLMRRPILLAFAFSMALSLGDLGVVAIFGSQDVQTLPYLILQSMGSYRSTDAAGLALVLCVMTMTLMMIADRGAAADQGRKSS